MSAKLAQRLQDMMLACTDEPSKKEMTAALTKVFKDKTAKAKEEKQQSGDKPKRKPSAYNIFYKEQSAILKESEQSKPKEERMSAKEKMAYIAGLWKASKDGDNIFAKADDAAEYESASSEAEEEANKQDDVEEEEEEAVVAPTPAPVAKFTTGKGKETAAAKSGPVKKDDKKKGGGK